MVSSFDQKTNKNNDQKSNDYFNVSVDPGIGVGLSYDGVQQIRSILGRNPDKSRTPYKNKVGTENSLYFYRAQPCTNITSFSVPTLFL